MNESRPHARTILQYGASLTIGLLACVVITLAGCHDSSLSPPVSPPPPRAESERSHIPTGRSINPAVPLASQDVGSLPVNMIASPDGRYAITTDGGYHEFLNSIRTSDGRRAGRFEYAKSREDKSHGLYYGLAIAPDGTLYASQGAADRISVLNLADDGTLRQVREIKTGKGDFPAGLALDERGYLYVANNDSTAPPPQVWNRPASAAIYDTATGEQAGRFTFPSETGTTTNFLLAIATLKNGSKTYVTSQRDGAVYILDTRTPSSPTLIGSISTGAHPDALLLNRSQSRLFVANAHSDTISVIDTGSDKIVGSILLRPQIARDLAGATPTALALSPDEKTLYACLADMNAVAVVALGHSDQGELQGYIPVGWYPTGIIVAPDGKRLLVANAKGTKAQHPNPPVKRRRPFILDIIEGNVISVGIPSGPELREQTDLVLENNRLSPRFLAADNPLQSIGLQAGKIKHVIYIVKENRTYDQVLGDLPQGNGDPKLCLFGREITPNLHALAERFVLLDNFYDSGEVSGDGWVWVTQAMANEYVVRNVPYSYSGRGRKYDYEGQNNSYLTGGFPALGPDGKPLSDSPEYKSGAKPITDVAESPGGHLWDLARKHNLTIRNYGMFVSNGVAKGKQTILPDNYPSAAGLQPGGHDLAGITDLDFRKFDLDYADSEAGVMLHKDDPNPDLLFARHTYGEHNAPCRFTEWKTEFDQMLAADPSGNSVPNLIFLRFPSDHSYGMNPQKHTPRSMVADNDFAVGQLVETISRSPIWKSSAIFIVEDDAQDGPDHVDAHRSTCYVISPWITPHSVDHSFQTTVSALRTMELLLGLPPMCEYDAAAAPILDWDTAPRNNASFTAIFPQKRFIGELNSRRNPTQPVSPALSALVERSMQLDFSQADQAPADVLNDLIWKSVRGPDSSPPASPHGPVPALQLPRGDDDD